MLGKDGQPTTESKKYLILYFVFTFAITWASWIISMLLLVQNGYPIPSIYTIVDRLENGYVNIEHFLLSFVFTIGTWGPMIAALIVVTMKNGKNGLMSLFSSILNFRIRPYWLIIIIAIPLVSFLAMLGVNAASGADISSAFQLNLSIGIIVLVFINQVFTSGLEEVGWRGFATPEFQKFRNAEDSGFYIGLIWGVWHAPFIWYLNISSGNTNTMLILLQLFGYVMLMAPMGIITVWMYNNTKSIGLLILSHAMNNFIPFLLGNQLVDTTGGLVVALVSWVLAIALTKKYGKETLLIQSGAKVNHG